MPGVTQGAPAGVAAPASDKTGTPTANKALGQLMAGAYGWTGNNWLCLESGWQDGLLMEFLAGEQ